MSDLELDGDDQRKNMRSKKVAICWSCRRWTVGTERCEAFPKGIPDEIFLLGFNHRKSFKGDKELQYVRKTD